MTQPMLTIEQILAARIPEAVVNVPQLGGAVRLKGLTRAEFAEVKTSTTNAAGETDSASFEAKLLAASMVEPAATPEQAQEMLTGAFAVVNPLLQAVMKLNGIGSEAAKAAEKSPVEQPGA